VLWFRRPSHRFASPRPKLIAVLPHDRGGWLQSYADSPALVDKGALGGNPFDNILGGQDWRHPAALPPFRRSPTASFERRP
jgi:hypothetical protein